MSPTTGRTATPEARDSRLATRDSLEAALLEVQATLAELLVAADEQYAAVVSRDRDRLESVTRLQERLTARLARAEARRMESLNGLSLSDIIARSSDAEAGRLQDLRESIATTVADLRGRQGQTANLLSKTIELGRQTLDFLQRIVTTASPAYNARGLAAVRQSVLVDGRA